MEDQDLHNLLGFLGYGTLEAPMWFLGMEEAFTETSAFTSEDNLRIHNTFDAVMDVQDAHSQMNAEYWKAKRLSVSAVWQWMAKLTLALMHGDSDWSDKTKVQHYIRSKLGRDQARGGETFLIELLPLPKRSAEDWPATYQALFPTRNDYENRIRPLRTKQLRDLISAHRPQYLFCYGQANYRSYQELVGASNWLESPLKDTKFWIKKLDDSYVVLTPFLGNGAISTAAMKTLIDYFQG